MGLPVLLLPISQKAASLRKNGWSTPSSETWLLLLKALVFAISVVSAAAAAASCRYAWVNCHWSASMEECRPILDISAQWPLRCWKQVGIGFKMVQCIIGTFKRGSNDV
jgi:hypothetical protein